MKINRFCNFIYLFLLMSFVTAASNNFHWEVVTNLNDAQEVIIIEDTLYAATTGGFIIYPLREGKPQIWNAQDNLTDHHFTALSLSEKNQMILGTKNGVVSFYHQDGKYFEENLSLQGNTIVSMQAVKDTLWIATEKSVAVFLYNPEKNRFEFRDNFTNFDWQFNDFRQIFYFNHKIWVGSNNGLFYAPGNFLHNNLKSSDTWTILTKTGGLPSNSIYSLNSREDTLLIGNANGLTKYVDQQFITFNTGLGYRPIHHIQVSGSKLYMDNGRTIFLFQNSQFAKIAKIEPQTINDFALDGNGTPWVAIKEEGIRNTETNQRIWFNRPVSNITGRILLDSQGRIWRTSSMVKFLTPEGFSVFQTDETWKNFRHLSPWKPTSTAQTIMEDTEGNIWIGSWNGGLLIIDPQFNFYHINNYTTNGKVWVSSPTQDDTLVFSPPDSVRHLLSYTLDDQDLLVVTDMMVDKSRNSLWLLVFHIQSRKSIIKYNGTAFSEQVYNKANWSRIAFPDKFSFDRADATTLTLDIFNNLWIGTEEHGVVRMQVKSPGDTAWLRLGESDNLKSDLVLDVAGDQDGYVWIGTATGLNAYLNGQLYDFRGDYQPIGLRINEIYVDEENNKWFATDKGVSLLKASGSPWSPDSWVHFVPENSEFFGSNIYHTNLPAEEVRGITVDENTGDVYCGTTAGMAIMRSNPFTTPLEELNRVTVGPVPLIIGNNQNSFLYFRNLTGNSQIKILTANGRLVKTLDSSKRNQVLGSFAQWNGTNDEGELVNTGVYLYLVTDEAGNAASGKFVVIRK